MTKSDLYRKWADTLDLCEKYKVKPYVKCNGYHITSPWFGDVDAIDSHQFPVGVLEGKLVFPGDKIWHKVDSKNDFIAVDKQYYSDYLTHNYSWNPRKPKTFTLNGVEFDLPSKTRTSCKQHAMQFGKEWYLFKDSREANDLLTLVQILLNGDADKL